MLESCPDDPELQKKVERLLDIAGQTPDCFLEPEEAPRVDIDAPTLEQGRVLLHYRVVSSLGQGGMGEVYRAVDTNMVKNADGSYDVYFSPKAPKGQENNWVQTVPGKGWNTIFRLYGPLEPWYDKTWRPGEIELVDQVIESVTVELR